MGPTNRISEFYQEACPQATGMPHPWIPQTGPLATLSAPLPHTPPPADLWLACCAHSCWQ